MKSFEAFGDALSLVILGKSPEVAGWAILLNFELRNLPFSRVEGVLLPTKAELLTYVNYSTGIPAEMVEPLICAWMSNCIQASDRISFGITESWSEACAAEENREMPGGMHDVEVYKRDGYPLFKLDVDRWKAWQVEHQVEFIVDEGKE